MSMLKPGRGRPTTHAQGIAVRERLLNAAGRLFYAEGIRAVGIDRVLVEAGAAKASLYAHFASKEELVAAYLTRRQATAHEHVTRHLARAGADPRARLMAIFDASASAAADPDFRGCPFLVASSELPASDSDASAICVAQKRWLRDLIREAVAEYAPASPDALAEAIIVLHDGAMSQGSSRGASDALRSARWAVEQLLELVVRTRPHANGVRT
jgi:AcrR family transcriptional regulator